MTPRKPFGKLGNRSTARLTVDVDARLTLPGRSATGTVENVSRTGCRLLLAESPRVGVTLLLRVDRIETLCSVVWVRGTRCGVRFANALPAEQLNRLRWIVDNAGDHEQRAIAHATAMWR